VSGRQRVEKAGPLRLFGYLGIFLVPLVLQLVPAMALRFAVVQPFRVPAGSMQPTINVGDYILVNKGSYGYSRYSFAPFENLVQENSDRWRAQRPERGDLVAFRPTTEPGRDFIKRIIGLPGDRIQMIGGVLHINEEAVARENLGEQSFDSDGAPFTAVVHRETLSNGVSYLTLDRGEFELDNTPVYTVPDNSYFMMGDDRDNSADSRVPTVVGFVPFENLVGRVDRVLTAR
jgi:signal peptidase I